MDKLIKVILIVIGCHLGTGALSQTSKQAVYPGARIRVILDSNSTNEKVWVTYKNHLWATNFNRIPNIQMQKSGMENLFQISFLPKEKAAYVSVMFSKNLSIEDFIIEPGDSIVCTYYKDKWYFTGRGNEKFKAQFDIVEAMRFVPRDMSATPPHTKDRNKTVLDDSFTGWFIEHFKTGFKTAYTTDQMALNVLDWYKEYLSDFTYNLIKVNTISQSEVTIVKLLVEINEITNDNTTNATNRTRILDSVSKLMSERRKYDLKLFPDSLLAYSSAYLGLQTLKSDSFIYTRLKDHFKGFLRDRLLTAFFLNNYYKQPAISDWLLEVVPTINDENCKELLLAKVDALMPGRPAFDFSLLNPDKKFISLKDFKGKVVMMDFWFTGCGSCIQLTEAMKPVLNHFKGNPNIIFIGVSIDKDFETWKKSLKSGLYNNEGTIDLYTNALGSEHPIIKHYGISGYPNLLLIDGSGKIITANPPRPTLNDPRKGKELIGLIEKNIIKL